jgi:hypothetical protein
VINSFILTLGIWAIDFFAVATTNVTFLRLKRRRSTNLICADGFDNNSKSSASSFENRKIDMESSKMKNETTMNIIRDGDVITLLIPPLVAHKKHVLSCASW